MRQAATLAGAAPLALLLLVFGAVAFWNLGAYEMLVWDEAEYASLGRSLSRGEGYKIGEEPHWIRPPLLPAAVAASLLAFGDGSDRIAKIPSALFAMAALALVYAIVRLECGAFPALLAACSLALMPELATGAVMLLSETPYLVFSTAALAAFFLGVHRHPRWFHLAWAALALAFLTRYTAMLFAPTLLLLLVYEGLRDRQSLLRLARTRAFWLAPLWFVIIAGAWLFRQWLVMGDPLIGIKYASNQIPAYAVAAMPWHSYLTSMPAALTWPVALAAAAGLAYALWCNRPLGVYAALSAIVVLGWHSQYDYKEVRLISSALPLFAIGVGFAAHDWERRFSGNGLLWRLAVPAAILAFALALSLRDVSRSFRTRIALGEPSFLEAMSYVRDTLPPGSRLLGENQAQIHWYSDRPTLRVHPSEEAFPSQLADVDWVVITNFERGQPAYLTAIAQRATASDQLAGNLLAFRDPMFLTILAKTDWVLRQLPGLK